MIVGIVGAEGAKFTRETEAKARLLIRGLLTRPGVTGYSSGRCHLGGADAWAEEIGDQLGLQPFVFAPRALSWEFYKARNLQIAGISDEVHCLTVKVLPRDFAGPRYEYCYHCRTNSHVKSGGCWTVKAAVKLGKKGVIHVI